MYRNPVKNLAVLGLLLTSTAGAAIAQQQIGPPSNTWNLPACQRIVGTSGVSYTADEGATLLPTVRPLTGTSYTSGLVALDTPNTLLAAVGSTILRSTDAGCQWRTVADLGAQSGYELLTLAKSRGDRAYIWSDNRGVFFRIDGTTITSLRSPAPTVVGLAADPVDADRLRAGDDRGQVYESRDAGASWQPVGVPAISNYWAYRVAFDPNNLDHVLVGSGISGAFISFDGGNTWQAATGLSLTGGNVNVFNAVISPADPSIVWAMGLDLAESDTDPGQGRYIFRSTDGGLTFKRMVHNLDGGVTLINGTYMAAHPTQPDVLYFIFGSSFANYGTDLFRLDGSIGTVTWTHNAYHGIRAIAFSPATPKGMYLGVVHEERN